MTTGVFSSFLLKLQILAFFFFTLTFSPHEISNDASIESVGSSLHILFTRFERKVGYNLTVNLHSFFFLTFLLFHAKHY